MAGHVEDVVFTASAIVLGFSIVINAFFIFIALTKTRHCIGVYKYLMICFAITNIMYSSVEFISRPVSHSFQPLITMFCCDQNSSSRRDSNPLLLLTGLERSTPLHHRRCLIERIAAGRARRHTCRDAEYNLRRRERTHALCMNESRPHGKTSRPDTTGTRSPSSASTCLSERYTVSSGSHFIPLSNNLDAQRQHRRLQQAGRDPSNRVVRRLFKEGDPSITHFSAGSHC
ncbi:unnamed protein product [Heligmosomoides polygyrus]|uniref:G_PROTEIN_RECEP_F1_2 domain-containing protein n=1 Tax=Heligmosomoides polygyrus TaxID=6339 RepID=A0A183FVY6_HELPZ|nr:unnamed protein product [Heligmosomoides polygyrus]